MDYGNAIGLTISILFLAVPLNVFACHRRMKKMKSDESLLFADTILAVWVLIFMVILGTCSTGAWYSENTGASRAQGDLIVTVMVLVLVLVHLSLFLSARKKPNNK